MSFYQDKQAADEAMQILDYYLEEKNSCISNFFCCDTLSHAQISVIEGAKAGIAELKEKHDADELAVEVIKALAKLESCQLFNKPYWQIDRIIHFRKNMRIKLETYSHICEQEPLLQPRTLFGAG